MTTDELSRQLHQLAATAPLRDIDSNAVIAKATRIRLYRRSIAACAVVAVVSAGVTGALLVSVDQGHIATITPQPFAAPAAQHTPSPRITPAPSTGPTKSPVPTATTPTVPPTGQALPAGWTAIGGLSSPSFLSRAAVGDKIVFWGQQDAAGGYTTAGQVFDVNRRVWTATPPSPLAGRDGVATAGSNRLFFAWGGDQAPPQLTPQQSATTPANQVPTQSPKTDGVTYDVATGIWHQLPSATLTAARPLGAIWNGQKFIVISNQRCAAYDPSTDRWQQLPSLPNAPGAASVVQVGNRTYVIGGYSYYLTSGAVSWTAIPSVQNAVLSTLTAATDGTTLFAAALTGARAGPIAAPLIVDRFNPVTATWIALPPSPAREAECLVPLAVTQRSVYVACATSSIYNRLTGAWQDYGNPASWGGTGPSVLGGNDPIAVGTTIIFPGSTTLIYSP
jgi:hypothetical protein